MKGKLLLSTLFFSGCFARFEPQGGFKEVQGLVAERGIGSIVWKPLETTNESPLDEALESLLQSPLNAEGAVKIALLNNRGLQALYEELGVAQVDLLQAGLLDNPVFSAERRLRGKALEFDIARGFLDVFLVPLRKRAAERDFEAAKLRVAHAVLAHAAETKTAFYEHEAACQMVATLRIALASSEASALAVSELQRAGNVAALDVLTAKGRAAEARLELAQAELKVSAERERLSVLMGLSGADSKGWKTLGVLSPLPREEPSGESLEKLAIERRLDLQAEKEAMTGIEGRLGIAGYAAALSGFAIEGHFEREASGEQSVGPSLSVPLPIFNQGRLATEAELASLRRAASTYLQRAVEVRSEVRLSLSNLRNARLRALYVQDELMPLQGKILQESLRQYNGMFLGPMELLEARRNQVLSERAGTEALRDYWMARSALELAIGGVSAKDLGGGNVISASTPSGVREPLPPGDGAKPNPHEHH